MAFRQPIVASRRPDPLPEPQENAPTVQSSAQQTALEESREWVLFSRSQAYSASQTRTTFTARTPQTAGRSRISDFGSIGITARSDEIGEGLARDTNNAVGDEEELDSLDEGLYAFHDPTMDRYTRLLGLSGAILPTHDGLGIFPPSSPQVQEKLSQSEQHNPRKRVAGSPLLSSSLRRHLDFTDSADGAKLDSEKRQRIENWRIDQSRLILDEIEKESRRMRWSQSSGQSDRYASATGGERFVESLVHDGKHQHMEGAVGSDNQHEPGPDESLWDGITRRLCDLLGIDEAILSSLFGEALPTDQSPSTAVSSSSPELASCSSRPAMSSLLPDWHGRLLDRLTRELGFLVQHLSEHPGGLSTHVHLPGANLSMLSASSPVLPVQAEKSSALHDLDSSSSLSPRFQPTLQVQPARASASGSEATDTALWGVEEEGHHSRLASITEERAYWESTPDVKSIFRLLRTRFAAPEHSAPPKPNNTATTSTLASLRRASVICQHHPLVSKGLLRRNRNPPLSHHHRHIFSLRRATSSCASISMRKGKRESGSSRNYWDLGGSGGGGGSAIAGTMSMGLWGEV